MKTLMVALWLIATANPSTDDFEIQGLIPPVPGTIIPIVMKCGTLPQIHSYIAAAEHGGPFASDVEYKQINAEALRAKKEGCSLTDTSSMPTRKLLRIVEGYQRVEIMSGILRDIIIMQKKSGKGPYYLVAREAALGQTL